MWPGSRNFPLTHRHVGLPVTGLIGRWIPLICNARPGAAIVNAASKRIPVQLFIISGLSGSGKSIALRAFEDLGFYCVDNLPAVLLTDFVKEMLARDTADHTRAAVSIDSRNRRFLDSLPAHLDALTALDLDYRMLYLEADDEVLVKRFSETRRRHPLTDDTTPLLEGIQRERALLAPLFEHAHRHINTSHTTPHELRRTMKDIAGGEQDAGPVLLFESFSYKNGTPIDADIVFDARCLPNPYWETALRDLSGLDRPVIEFLDHEPTVTRMVEQIRGFIEYWLPSFEAENRSYITVAIGCTGGRHRSVYIAGKLHDYFAAKRPNVHLRHREIAPATGRPNPAPPPPTTPRPT